MPINTKFRRPGFGRHKLSEKRGPPRNKYGAKKTELDGHVFDSIGESQRYAFLKAMEKRGEITGLILQKRFVLKFKGEKICDYFADFVYYVDGVRVVEDFKSGPTKTDAYRLKKKLMKVMRKIEIYEVEKPKADLGPCK